MDLGRRPGRHPPHPHLEDLLEDAGGIGGLGRAVEGQAAVLQHGHLVRHPQGLVQVVQHHEHGLALAGQAGDEGEQL